MLMGLTDEGREAWAKLTANFDKAGFPWREPDDFVYPLNQVFTGDVEGAINTFLEYELSRPLASDLELYTPRDKRILGEVYADPRVAKRLAELETEFLQMREEVRELMLQPEWNL